MKRIEVISKEYKLFPVENDCVLYTTELNDEIACSFFSITLKKVGLGRNLTQEQLRKLIEEMNPNNLLETGLIKIQIVGGNESETSKKYLESLIEALSSIDNDRDIIDIISLDACQNLHPNSFELDCYHGGIRYLSVLSN